MRKHKGLFITIEGSDGTGKSTQTRLVIDKLKEMGFQIEHTREPGGTFVSEKIRHLLLEPENKMFPMTELLLYEASRYQNTYEKIVPALEEGKIVICERYIDASTVYQGYGRGLPLETIESLNMAATGGILPDVTFIFFMDFKEGLKRARAINKTGGSSRGGDRLEREGMKFHRRISEGYLDIAKKHPHRIKLVRVEQGDIGQIFNRIMKIILKEIRSHKCLKK